MTRVTFAALIIVTLGLGAFTAVTLDRQYAVEAV